MAKVKNKRNSGKADKVHNKKKSEINKKKLNPFEVHINREKLKVLGKKSKHDRGLPGVARAKAIQKRKETLGTEMKLMNKTNAFIDRRIGEKDKQLSVEDRMVARFAAERARQHTKKNIYNLADDEILTHRGQTLEQIEKFDDPRSSDDEDDSGLKKFGGLGDEFVSDAHFGGGVLSKAQADGAKSHKDLIEQLIAESKKRKAEKQKEKEQTLDLTEKLDSEWKDLQPVVFKRAREEESLIDKVLSQAEKNNQDYDKMMRELKFDRRGTPSDGLKSDEKQAKEEREKLEQLEKERQQRMLGEDESFMPRVPQTSKHRSADDLDDNFELDDEKDYMLAYDKDGKPLVPDHVLKNFTVPNAQKKFQDGASESNDDGEESDDEETDDDSDESSNEQETNKGNEESILFKKDDVSDSSESDDDENDETRSKINENKTTKESKNKSKKQQDSESSSEDDDDDDNTQETKQISERKKQQDESSNQIKVKKNKHGNSEESESESEDETARKETKKVNKRKETKIKKQISKSDDESSDEEESNTQDIEPESKKAKLRDDEIKSESETDSDETETKKGKSKLKGDDIKSGADNNVRKDDLNDLRMSESEDEEEQDVERIATFEFKAGDENLKELLTGKTPSQQSTAIQKLIKKYDPSLAENNKEQLSRLYAHMLQYINDIFSNLQNEGDVIKAFLMLDSLAPHFYDLAHTNKVSTKKFMTELLTEKREKFMRNKKRIPDLDTLVFFKLVSLIYPTSDYRHPVTTPCLVFMSEILSTSKFNDAYSISRGLFLVALVLEYTALSKRYLPAAINFLRGILYLSANTSILNPIQVVPPFRLHRDSKILNLEDNCKKMAVEHKMAARDLAAKEIDNDFKIRCLLLSCLMLKEFFVNCNDIEAQGCMFEPHLQLIARVDLELYPKKVISIVGEVIQYMKETLEMKTYTPLSREKKKPKALRLYEPDIQEVFTGSKSSKLSRERAETARLQYKIKKEMKGAIREIRRDKAYIASVKIRQKIQSDNMRKDKVKQIYKDAAIQQGELNQLKRAK